MLLNTRASYGLVAIDLHFTLLRMAGTSTGMSRRPEI